MDNIHLIGAFEEASWLILFSASQSLKNDKKFFSSIEFVVQA